MREEMKLDTWGYESKRNIFVDILVAYLGAKLGEKI